MAQLPQREAVQLICLSHDVRLTERSRVMG